MLAIPEIIRVNNDRDHYDMLAYAHPQYDPAHQQYLLAGGDAHGDGSRGEDDGGDEDGHLATKLVSEESSDE